MSKKKLGVFVEIIGWLGVFLILLAYILVSLGVIDAKAILYQLLNLIGSVGVVCISWLKRDKQPMVLNIIWASIALFALITLILPA